MLLDKCPLSGKMGRGGGDVEQNSLGRGVSGGPGSALREGKECGRKQLGFGIKAVMSIKQGSLWEVTIQPGQQ